MKVLREAATMATSGPVDLPRVRVIAVEDDDDFREVLTAELSDYGFDVEAFPDAPSVLNSLSDGANADVVILDWGLPGTSGIELLSQLRSLGVALPVVFLTGRVLTANELLAFDRGAVDFIDKTRGLPILARRLRLLASARSGHSKQEKVLAYGRLTLKPDRARACWGGTDIDLTFGEFKIIHLLAANAGHYVTYREIYDCMRSPGFAAGAGEEGYRTNVRAAIKRVREKFRSCDPDFDGIGNEPGIGYVWGRAVEASSGESKAAS
jgi:two-component system response regulator ChvI